ncbi:MAG: RNase P modulator RnpM [Eubacteriales bacterium]|jgi:predicted RNA-binding protein YlxR (DUF448 family)
MKPKPELIRVVRSTEGDISIDLKGKKPGRGAYICQNETCLDKAIKTRALERALSVKIPRDLPDQLRMELKNETG